MRLSDESIKILCKRIAFFLASGSKVDEIAKEISVSINTVRKYSKHPYTVEELKNVALELNVFKTKLREEMSRRLSKIVSTLDFHLDKKNLKAAEIIMDIMQIKNDKGEEKDTSVSVHLDLGNTPTKVIEGEYNEVQNRQGTQGIRNTSREQPTTIQITNPPERIHTTELQQGDMSNISVEISGGTSEPVQGPGERGSE